MLTCIESCCECFSLPVLDSKACLHVNIALHAVVLQGILVLGKLKSACLLLEVLLWHEDIGQMCRQNHCLPDQIVKGVCQSMHPELALLLVQV